MNYKKESIITLTVLCIVILLAAFFTYKLLHKPDPAVLAPSAVEDDLTFAAEETGFTDINGSPVVLDGVLDGIVVANSWASWSPASASELARLSRVAESYQAGEVTILAINRAEPANTAQRFINTIPQHNNITLILDPTDSFYKSIGGYAMPETVFYDREGNVVFHSHSALSETEIRLYIDQALQ